METVDTQKLSSRVLNMAESATLAMSKNARALKAQGHDVISLSLGEPDFDTPQHIKDAVQDALNQGFTKYTPVPGLPILREAIQTKFKRDNGLEYSLDEIAVSNGAKQSIANLSLALLDDGDEVMIFSPYWVSYYEIVKLGKGTPKPLFAGIESDFKVTAEQVRAALTPNTKMVLFSSPCNPTGSVYTLEELTAIADVLKERKDIVIVSDEIYEYINFTGKHASIGAIASVKDQVVTVNGFAKGFAMTGWRLGYIGGPKWVVAACNKIQGQFTSGANAFAQRAAVTALLGDMTPTHEMGKAFLKRRDMMLDLLKEIPGMKLNVPKGAFYIFPDISAYIGKSNGDMTITDDVEFCNYILNVAHVAIVPGSAFGADGCFRISYAASEEQLREAVRRMAEALAKLS